MRQAICRLFNFTGFKPLRHGRFNFPSANKKNLTFLFFDSKLYHPRVQKRAELTKQVIKKNGISIISHELKGQTKLAQAFEVLQLGSWVSYYLGLLNGVDPVKIPWVDWFKKRIKINI